MNKSNILRFCLIGIALLISVFVQAKEPALGLVPLNIEQRYQAAKAAPTGNDAPLPIEIPKLPIAAMAEVKSAGTEVRVEPSKLEEKANEALNTVSLDERIQQQSLRTELVQFGYELFNKPAVTFSPAETLPVPGDYVVAPGDTFAVQVFGATDVQYKLVVTRDGRLLLPEVGAVNVAGLTFDESKLAIQSLIGKVRIGVQTVVTLADLQAIQVVVMGEIHKPGTFTVPGMTNLFNALVNTGGIKTTGSLRNVELRRQNQLVAKLDLYDMLLSGKSRNNPYLRQGDVIFVPPLGPTVSVAGEVNRPAIYELLRPISVQSAIDMAGGLLPTADPSKTQLRRLQGGKTYTLIQADLTKPGASPLISNGDQIRVFPALNRMDDIVLLSGNVITPGAYQWKQGMRISDLVKDVQLLQQRTDFNAALLVRERRISRRINVQYIALGQALEQNESAANIKLQPRDELIIFDTNSPRDKALANTVQALRQQASVEEPAEVIELKGFVKHPGAYPLEQGKRLLDLIRAAGGVQDGTDMNYALLIRKTDLSQRIEPIAISLGKALAKPLGDHNPSLVAGDRVYLFDPKVDRPKLLAEEIETLVRQAGYGESAPIVQVTGKARQSGQFPLTPGMTVKDLIDAAGGLKEDAYGQTAVLTREDQMANEYMRAQHTEVNLLGKNQVLPDASLRLKARDRLVIREKPEGDNIAKWVTVKGEVRFPGKYSVSKRETLCEFIRRAGGFTQDAYLFGTVFSRESVRKREQENIDKIFREFDTLLAELHTSPSYDNDKKLTTQKSANDTYQVIRQLKPPTAVGRMVIEMEKAGQQCIEVADFILEDGDQIEVPKLQEEVTVVGQVYHPMSHKYKKERGALDYVNLSGGPKELAQREHAFVIQANGEVVSLRSSMSSWTWLSRPENISVTPGSIIVVPLTVDRINGREYTQSLIDTLFKAAVGTIGIKSLFGL